MEKRSACPLDCPDLCGLTVTIEEGRVARVDGDRRSELTDGFICGKVRKIADHLYGGARVLHPMIRSGAKGAGQWRRASWDEALGLVADRIATIRGRSGAEAVLPYHYGGSNGWLTEGALASRFFRRLGASNLDRTFCASAVTPATRGLYGQMPGIALEDFVHAKLIVLWGVNLSATGIHSVPIIERAREAGAKLVVVDPRRTPLARRADLHLAVRPGADLPVALAIVRALFDRGHADRAFLAKHATGVEDLQRRASVWSIEDAAREARIDARDLDAFVELYAASSPAAIRVGFGLERNRNGGSAVAAILTLPAVGGKFGVRGGGYTTHNGDARWGVTSETAIHEAMPAARTINMAQIADALANVRDPRVECLFVYNCNPVSTAPDQKKLVAELAREDLFTVVHEQVWTDTAQLADVVLPATAFLEHRELRRGYGAMRMFDSPAVVAPPGEARSNNQLFGELIQRLGLARAGEPVSDDELVAATLAPQPGLREQLARDGVALSPLGRAPVAFVDVLPGTADEKIHLVPEELDRAAIGGLYMHKPDPETQEYPLALISPALATQISSTFGQLRTAPATLVLSPRDAAARGIQSGDSIRAWNATGEVHCIAEVSTEVREGVVMMNKGLWRKHSKNGFTATALIPFGTADLGGQAAFNDARIQVGTFSPSSPTDPE